MIRGLEAMPTYLVELNLADREAVVVGGGPVAAFKVAGLVASGLAVRVVSRKFVPELARRTDIAREQRSYSADVLDGAGVVFACTADWELNRRIVSDARARGILCNVVDDPDLCDFFVPAVLRRGRLTIGVGTSGAAPALAAAIRDRLESHFAPEWAKLVDALGLARRRIHERIRDGARRSELLRLLGGGPAVDLFLERGFEAWQEWADRLIETYLDENSPGPRDDGADA